MALKHAFLFEFRSHCRVSTCNRASFCGIYPSIADSLSLTSRGDVAQSSTLMVHSDYHPQDIKVLPHFAYPIDQNCSILFKNQYRTSRKHVSRRRILLPPSHVRQRLAQLVRLHILMRRSIRATDKHSVVNGERKKSGLIRKYGLNMSRQAFREKATDMGWVKVCTRARSELIGN